MAAECYHSSIARIINPPNPKRPNLHAHRASHVTCSAPNSQSSTSSNYNPQWKKMARKVQRPPKPLIKLSTSDGRWHGQWTVEYVFTLRELHLSDLAQDGEQDAEVLVCLSVHKHAGFGFSIEGRIATAFTSRCSSCFSPYCREINTAFNVWVLPSSKSEEFDLPEIGGDDPSVIYVKPGCEADLDSLIQDTIRLTASAKDTCSETCEKSTARWQYVDGKRSYDQRWSRLLDMKNSL